MDREEVFRVVIRNICEVLPELEGYAFRNDDKLKDLGANSVDRAEIVAMSLESLDLEIPLVELSKVSNIGELAEVLYEKLQSN